MKKYNIYVFGCLLIAFFMGIAPILGADEAEKEDTRRTGAGERTVMFRQAATPPHTPQRSWCDTANDCMATLTRVLKMGIGIPRAMLAFYALDQDKFNCMTHCCENTFKGPVEPLSTEEDWSINRKLYEDVVCLSYPKNFNLYPDNLVRAGRYITHRLEEIGYAIKEQKYCATPQEIEKCLIRNGVGFNGNKSNPIYEYKGIQYPFATPLPDRYEFTNIIAKKKGTGKGAIIFFAHTDSINLSPGANDNGSAIAVLLQLADALYNKQDTRKTIYLVFGPNEEMPLSRTEYMGSRYFLERHLLQKKQFSPENCFFIALETLGSYTEAGKQDFKIPALAKRYPDQTANFVAFISKAKNMATGEPEPLLIKSTQYFSKANRIRSEILNVPMRVLGYGNRVEKNREIDSFYNLLFGDIIETSLVTAGHSDHWSAWYLRIPGIMITDTTRNKATYHTIHDKPAEINFPYLTRVAQGLLPMTIALANDEAL